MPPLWQEEGGWRQWKRKRGRRGYDAKNERVTCTGGQRKEGEGGATTICLWQLSVGKREGEDPEESCQGMNTATALSRKSTENEGMPASPLLFSSFFRRRKKAFTPDCVSSFVKSGGRGKRRRRRRRRKRRKRRNEIRP